jgi:hypothetical protein
VMSEVGHTDVITGGGEGQVMGRQGSAVARLFGCPGSFGCSDGAAAGKGFDKGGGEQRPKREAGDSSEVGSFVCTRIENGGGRNG